MTYDAVLIASFGGPEGPAEIMPFLERVAAGRNIPADRLEAVHQHYLRMGGSSPINAQNRALVAALAAELDTRGVHLPLALANRNSPPFFADVLTDLHAAGHRRVLAIATSMYSSYSSCRQYREDLAAALGSTGLDLDVVKVRPGYDRSRFVETTATLLAEALGERDRTGLRVLFTTHSIPLVDARASGPGPDSPDGADTYSAQHRDVARAVVDAVAAHDGRPPLDWRLVYQSRSGPPHVPWLEPDVNDALREEAAAGTTAVVLAPIGFVSDHIEVMWDLDTDARATTTELGLEMIRLATVGTHPTFVAGLADQVEAHLAAGRDLAPAAWAGFCGPDCCTNPRVDLPTVPGVSA